MSYRFIDGRPVTPDSVPPVSTEMRIAALEQRVADLELIVMAIAKGGETHDSLAAKLKGA